MLSSLLDADARAGLHAIFGERAQFDAALAPHTSWRIGGPADALLLVETTDELAGVLSLVAKRKVPWYVLGSGSNLLVGDGGIRGIVVRLAGDFTRLEISEETEHVVVHAGASSS